MPSLANLSILHWPVSFQPRLTDAQSPTTAPVNQRHRAGRAEEMSAHHHGPRSRKSVHPPMWGIHPAGPRTSEPREAVDHRISVVHRARPLTLERRRRRSDFPQSGRWHEAVRLAYLELADRGECTQWSRGSRPRRWLRHFAKTGGPSRPRRRQPEKAGPDARSSSLPRGSVDREGRGRR